jgi:type IV secretion system protein TrbL
MILTSIEMFMARIEFYTMALITIPLLPFIMLNKFAFLAEKAIGGMFNLAIKLSVISFISAMAIPFMMTFQTKMAAAKDPWTQPALLFQAVLAALVIYMLTKKIPELVTSLLNGQPNLNGAGMMDMAKGAANTAATAAATAAGGVGAVKGASALASAAGKGGVKGTLAELGKSKLMSTAPVARYRQAIENMDNLKRNTGEAMLKNLSKGRYARKDLDKDLK